MKITIKTVFGKNTFDLEKNHVLALIQQAAAFAADEEPCEECEGCAEEEDARPLRPAEEPIQVEEAPKPVPAEKPEKPAEEKSAPKSRVEAMFGKKDSWDMPAKAEKPVEAVKPVVAEAPKPTYTGFLYMRCESCGKEKGYCAKVPISHHKCECGHLTELSSVKPARVLCECGGDFTYKTNIQDRSFTINCLSCGTPVDLGMNKWAAYSPIAKRG